MAVNENIKEAFQMEKVVVDQSFWDLFPDAQVNILYANGIDNHDMDKNVAERRKMLANADRKSTRLNSSHS